MAKEQTAFPKSVHWQPYGVAQGYGGLALLCSVADACMPGEGWDTTGHGYLQCAVRAVEQRDQPAYGMASGIGGLAFAAWSLARNGTRYRKLQRSLDEAVIARITDATRVPPVHGGSVSSFDMISGLAGVGRFLLCSNEPEHRAALEAVVRWLIALTEEQDGVPHWHTPARFISDATTRLSYPHGNLNCGLAHGIPGPLALLSLAAAAGVQVEGHLFAIRRIAEWLRRYGIQDRWGCTWPTAVPLGPGGSLVAPSSLLEQDSTYRPSRTAWCYGSPGVARSLWLAGQALNEPDYADLAVATMEAVYRRPVCDRHVDAPTFCHGVAGLQQITLRFAHDTGLPLFKEAGRALHRQLLEAYEPASLLGYRNLEPGGRRIDQPGLLDGAPGVAMVLLAAATQVEPVWDRLFLLS